MSRFEVDYNSCKRKKIIAANAGQKWINQISTDITIGQFPRANNWKTDETVLCPFIFDVHCI